MKLSYLKVKNLRCIGEFEIRPRRYTTLIGPNNAGKSTALRAIELFLNQETPAPDEWRHGYENEPIEIEGEFDELEDWERSRPGIAAHVNNDRIRLRVHYTLTKQPNGKMKVDAEYESFREEEAIDDWDDTWTKLHPDWQALAKDNGITGTNFKQASKRELLRSLIREKFPHKVKKGAPAWTSDSVSIPVAFQQALPVAQVIPAVRDAAEDGQFGAKTSFGLLVKQVILPTVSCSDEYKALLAAVGELEKKLTGNGADQMPELRKLAEEISERLSYLVTARVALGMEAPDAEKFIGTNTLLRLDDGTPTRIALQGHGLQRALIFAMLEILASRKAVTSISETEKRNRKTVLLFEEPELFIHPHVMRRLKEILESLADKAGWQVIVTTHSPFLVDVAKDPLSLVIHQRVDSKKCPTAKQLDKDPFEGGNERAEERDRLRAVLDFHPTVCEAFFAQHVVLVEGDTEMAVLVRQPKLYELAGVAEQDRRHVTIVSCDGKWTIVPIARLLKAFGVRFRVIHDKDLDGRKPEEITSSMDPFQANAKIESAAGKENVFTVEDTFEHVLWPDGDAPNSKSDKPYRAWKRVHELCDGKSDLSHVPKLKQVVDFAFGPFN